MPKSALWNASYARREVMCFTSKTSWMLVIAASVCLPGIAVAQQPKGAAGRGKEAASYGVGEKVEVLWAGGNQPAEVISIDSRTGLLEVKVSANGTERTLKFPSWSNLVRKTNGAGGGGAAAGGAKAAKEYPI